MSRKNHLGRRQFLKSALAGSASLAVGSAANGLLAMPADPKLVAAAGAPPAEAGKIPLAVLGRTGEKVPRLLQGTAMDFDVRLLKAAYEQGVTYFDTADCYAGGNSELTVGQFLKKTGLRKQIWLTTKSCVHDPAGMLQRLQTSLGRLQTDHVDLFFLHNLGNLSALDGSMKQAVEKLKKEGKIRHFGFSTHAPNVSEALVHASKLGGIDAIMFKYNFRDYGDTELNRAIDAAKKAGIGLIAMKTQASAFSFQTQVDAFRTRGLTRHQAVLKAVWEDERIDAVVSHMSNVQQIEQNAEAARNLTRLGALELEELRRYAKKTSHLYCRGCDHVCSPALERPVAVASTLRLLMYHDEYGEFAKARRLYGEMPSEMRDFEGLDLEAASRACPYKLDVARLIGRARKVLG